MFMHTQTTTLTEQPHCADEPDPNGVRKKRHRKEDTVNNFETPMKELQKIASPSTDHPKARMQKTPAATCNENQEKESEGATAHELCLRVQCRAKAKSCVVKTTAEQTLNEVKEEIGLRINVAAEFLKLSSPADTAKPKFNWPLCASNWQDGSTITCHILEKPTSFDRVAQCDECGDLRHVFYSYARQCPWAEPEPVIELCADCNNPIPRCNKSLRATE